MNIEQLKQLISQGESHHLEFKKSTTQIKAAFETICAFLNSSGGIVLIGVSDNGQIIGQHVTDKTKQELARELSKIEPKTLPELHYIDIGQDKQVIAIEISASKHIPHAYDGRPFERNQSTTERMSQHRYEQLIVNRGQLNHSWEQQPAYGYKIDDLDHEEIKRTIKEGVDKNRISVEVLDYDIEHILTRLKLLENDRLINAAVVLYAKDVEPYYSRCMIRMARFKGIDNLGDFIDNQRVYGNAFQLIKAALNFTQRHLPIASYFKPDRMQRIDQPAIPALALREALINAISHRDYTNGSSTISLAIFDDRLEIWNAGLLPQKLKIEDLKKRHNSYPRNERIATVIYSRGWVEGWGTGTLRMAGYCQQNETPTPEFVEYSEGFAVVFQFKEPMNSVGQTPVELSLFRLTSRRQKIVDMLKNKDTMTANEIMQQLQEPLAARTLRDDLAYLKQVGIINSQGHARTATWFLMNKK